LSDDHTKVHTEALDSVSDNAGSGTPQLASIVREGEGQSTAIAIEDYIFMAKDISNAYLVTTSAGDVLINAGFMGSAERNKLIFDQVRSGPLKYLVLTQAHADHFGGVPVLADPDTKVVAERRFTDTCEFFDRLAPYLKARSGKIWSGVIRGRDKPVPKVIPDIEVVGEFSFDVGETRFDVISVPGGEAPDALVVWLPREKVVFTGNLFGPVFMSMPNLCTLRGDKPRSARLWLDCLLKVRDLEPDLLITGHGAPVRGAGNIRQALERMYAAVTHVLEQTLSGMNAGKDVYTLMREIHLPEEIAIAEHHGKVAWAVRTIWEEYSGWFHMDFTTSLYGIPRSSIDSDLTGLAGGASALAERAQERLIQNQPLQALHLLEVALGAEPDCRSALAAKKAVIEVLRDSCGGVNMSETAWLENQLAQTQAALGEK